MFVRHSLIALVAVLTAAASFPGAAQAQQTSAPPEFVALDEVDPTILHDIRYHEQHNFVGRRIHDYYDPICVLTRPAAEALAAAQQALRPQGYTLKVYDCYRPQTAVDDFVGWARRLHDDRMKAEFYPRVDKSRLFADGYIAERSGHSRGSTVDLTLVRLPAAAQPRWQPSMGLVDCAAPYAERFPDNTIDMGTSFDCSPGRSGRRPDGSTAGSCPEWRPAPQGRARSGLPLRARTCSAARARPSRRHEQHEQQSQQRDRSGAGGDQAPGDSRLDDDRHARQPLTAATIQRRSAFRTKSRMLYRRCPSSTAASTSTSRSPVAASARTEISRGRARATAAGTRGGDASSSRNSRQAAARIGPASDWL